MSSKKLAGKNEASTVQKSLTSKKCGSNDWTSVLVLVHSLLMASRKREKLWSGWRNFNLLILKLMKVLLFATIVTLILCTMLCLYAQKKNDSFYMVMGIGGFIATFLNMLLIDI